MPVWRFGGFQPRCPVHQGAWSAYGVVQRKEREAKAKKRKIRKKR